jgi:hypothetical protein
MHMIHTEKLIVYNTIAVLPILYVELIIYRIFLMLADLHTHTHK